MITAPFLHAMVIHFPIALLITGFLSEIIAQFSKRKFYKDASFYLLILGTIAAIVAVASGLYASNGMTEGILQEPIELHKETALATLFLAIITSLLRIAKYHYNYQKKWAKWASFLFFAVLIGFVSRTGYLGGQLVFKYRAGINTTLPEINDQTKE